MNIILFRNSKISLEDKLITISLIIFPLLWIYGYNHVNFGVIFFAFCFIYKSIKSKTFSIEFPKYLLLFFLYMIITRILSSNSVFSSIPLNILVFLLILGYYCRYFSLEYGIKVYRTVAFISIFFFVLQELSFAATGYRIMGIVTSLPITFDVDSANYFEQLQTSDRSSSFFREPAAFAQFLLPFLAIELFYNPSKKSFARAVIITLVLILLQSGNGIFGLILVWLAWYIYKAKQFPLFINFLFSVVLAVIILIGGSFFFSTEKGQKLLERQIEIGNSSTTTSGFIRIFRGYYVYNDMNNFDKICGVNNNDKIREVINKSSVSMTFADNDTYFNTVQSIMIYGGIIGVLLFLPSFLYLLIHNSYCGKIIMLLFFLLSFIASLYLSSIMILCYVFSYTFQKHVKKDNTSCEKNRNRLRFRIRISLGKIIGNIKVSDKYQRIASKGSHVYNFQNIGS